MRLYLIQRGNFRLANEISRPYLYGRGCLLDLDYMGSAEFEWGAVPAAYKRIWSNFNDFVWTTTNIKNTNGLPFVIFSRKNDASEIETELKHYINKPYLLKDWINLDKYVYTERCFRDDSLKYAEHFWWDIEHDWFGFFGASDRISAITTCIKHDAIEFSNIERE